MTAPHPFLISGENGNDLVIDVEAPDHTRLQMTVGADMFGTEAMNDAMRTLVADHMATVDTLTGQPGEPRGRR